MYQNPPRDPHSLSYYQNDPPPQLRDYQQRYSRRGVGIAILFEGAVLTFLLILNYSIVLLGLFDGVDEFFSCISLIAGAILTTLGWFIGSTVAYARYRQDFTEWQARNNIVEQP